MGGEKQAQFTLILYRIDTHLSLLFSLHLSISLSLRVSLPPPPLLPLRLSGEVEWQAMEAGLAKVRKRLQWDQSCLYPYNSLSTHESPVGTVLHSPRMTRDGYSPSPRPRV